MSNAEIEVALKAIETLGISIPNSKVVVPAEMRTAIKQYITGYTSQNRLSEILKVYWTGVEILAAPE